MSGAAMASRPRGTSGRRSGGHGLRLAAAGVMMGALIAGCGEGPPMSLPAVSSTADATPQMATMCWSDNQRIAEGEQGEGMPAQYSAPPAMRIDPARRYTGTIETNKGAIQVEFFPEDAPKTVNNFVCLAEDGYYDGTPVHRIVKGFVIQGGDPTGTGAGGPGYRFEDEPVRKDYERGTLAMANAGPNTNGSQFFIVLDDLRGKLPKNYTIFGRVTDGFDVVDAIAETPTTASRGAERSTPMEPVTLEKVTISES